MRKYKRLLVNIMFSLLVPLIGAIYFLRDIIFPLSGFIFYGDVCALVKFDWRDFAEFCLFVWKTG